MLAKVTAIKTNLEHIHFTMKVFMLQAKSFKPSKGVSESETAAVALIPHSTVKWSPPNVALWRILYCSL